MKSMFYKDKLAKLKLPTLELRRLRTDFVLGFKILHRFIAWTREQYGMHLCSRVTRGHDMRLLKTHDRMDARKHYFGSRITNPWNSLPSELVHSASVIIFKRGFTEVDLSDYFLQDCGPM